MSDDIIERLKSADCYDFGSSSVIVGWLRNDPIDEAVEEIERLRARVASLNEALAIYVHAHETGNSVPPHIEAAARAALEVKP